MLPTANAYSSFAAKDLGAEKRFPRSSAST